MPGMRSAWILLGLATLLHGQETKLIIHADDLGFSHAANRASLEMLEKGYVSSASVMMPCGWVAEVAEWSRRHPDKDLGLHLTLNSEWKALRWGPVAPRDRVPNLVDPEGYLWASPRDTARRAGAQEVETELRAQIEKARAMGIRFTHLDTHMGTLYARPDYFQVYEKLGREYKVPVMLVKPSEEVRGEAPAATVEFLLKNEERFRRQGVFRLDRLLTNPARGASDLASRRAAYHAALRGLGPGVHQIILHPAVLSPELRAATASAVQRDLDYRIFSDPGTVKLMADLGIQLVGWRDVAPPGGL